MYLMKNDCGHAAKKPVVVVDPGVVEASVDLVMHDSLIVQSFLLFAGSPRHAAMI